MNMPTLSDEFIAKWEHIISGIEPTNVPLKCIERLTVRLKNRRRRTINLTSLRKQGLTEEELETVINRQLAEHEPDIVNISFYVDVGEVANIVQPVTELMLKEL